MTISELWQVAYASVNSIEVTAISSVYKLLVSLLLGCIVGYERKRKGQPVGMRTFSLIAMGSTLAMILSIYVPQEYLGLKNGDPGRIAAQVVTGIGFLGAGAIIQMKGSVRGLTTAAGIWLVAAIGMAVGVGMYVIATIATLFSLLILVAFDKFEHKINLGSDMRSFTLTIDTIVDSIQPYIKIFDRYKVHLTRYNIDFDYTASQTILNMIVLAPQGADFPALLRELRDIHPTLSLSVTNQTAL